MLSYWIDSTQDTTYPGLDGDLEVDVAVIGGGITGLTAALLLKNAGKSVALIEMKRIVRGATGYTTAKATAGHSLIYSQLEKRFGGAGARTYAEANSAGLELIRSLVEELTIDCDLETRVNYAYAESAESVSQIREEAGAAKRAGLPATFVTDTPLPFRVAGAVRLDGQAQFHPRKYLLPIAAAITGDGSHIFEETRATDVRDSEPCVVKTDVGTVRARDVVLATHLPFEDKSLLFAATYPQRSYVVAAPIDAEAAPKGMFISVDQPTRSLRTTPYDDGVLLLVGGEGHKTGQTEGTREPYARLESWAEERFGLRDFPYRWATHDYASVDRAPFVGRAPLARHVWVATGYGKWGMTNGTAAAMLLGDLILGRSNRWSDLFSAQRPRALLTRAFVSENVNVAKCFFADRLRLPGAEALTSLAPGEGIVLRAAGEGVAVSRGEDGSMTGVSPRCTHLGCYVRWNTAERTWDCPCHGSRYLPNGSVIEGPAVADLTPRQVPSSPAAGPV